jgi:hypothetical protein
MHNLKVNLTIPEVYIFIPSKSATTKDMLKLKLNHLILDRSDPAKVVVQRAESQSEDEKAENSTMAESCFPFKLSLASCSLGVADWYTSMEADDIEVPKMEKTQNIFRTEKIELIFEGKLKETKKKTVITRLSNGKELKLVKLFSAKSYSMQATLPSIYAELDMRALAVILQLFDLWVVNVPFILHPYLEISQFERVSELMKDKVFCSFKFSGDLLDRIKGHNLLSYDIRIKEIFLTCDFEGSECTTS